MESNNITMQTQAWDMRKGWSDYLLQIKYLITEAILSNEYKTVLDLLQSEYLHIYTDVSKTNFIENDSYSNFKELDEDIEQKLKDLKEAINDEEYDEINDLIYKLRKIFYIYEDRESLLKPPKSVFNQDWDSDAFVRS